MHPKSEARIFKKHSLKRVFAVVRRVCWVGLLTYDAPERTAACLALLPVVLSCMSAFDLLLARSTGSATPSGSSQTVNGLAVTKAEKRFLDLSRRRANALSEIKGTAGWWKSAPETAPDATEEEALLLLCA